MERRIEYAHHGHARHQLLAYTNTDQVGRIVQGSQICTFLKSLNHIVIHDDGAGELLSAVHNPVADGVDLRQILNGACFVIYQSVQYNLDPFLVGRHGRVCNLFLTAFLLINQAAVDADSLAEALGQHFFRL